jgi:hypothetical protein
MPMNPRLLRPIASRNLLLNAEGVGAHAAFSLRRLSASYTGAVVRVRRSSDNAEADFTASQVNDIAAWVGSGNDGFVRTWYDQAGSGRHAQQSTSGLQPRIVSSGSLNLDANQPALLFNDTRGDQISVPINGHSVMDIYGVMQTTDDQYILFCAANTGSALALFIAANAATAPQATSGSPTYYANGTALSSPTRNTLRTTFQNARKTFTITGADTADAGWSTSPRFSGYGVGFDFSGNISELIIYASSTLSRRASIEANINKYYSVY